MAKEIKAAMTVLAVCETNQAASSVTVAYVLYADDTVGKIGPKSEAYRNSYHSIIWPFSEEEAKELLKAKMNGLL